MRGSRGVSARDIAKVVHFPASQKPAPIVPKRLIEGVSERVDCFGEVVVPLNESEAEAAIRRLVAEGVEAIAVCFLWSFKNPAHERRVKEMIRDYRAAGVRVLLGRHRAQMGRVRAHHRYRAERLHRAGDGEVPRQSGPAAQSLGLRSAAADHAVRRRLDLGRPRDGVAAADARLGAGVGRHRRRSTSASSWACRTSSPPTWAAPRSTSASSTTGSPSIPSSVERRPVRILPAQGRHPGDRLGRRQPRPRRRASRRRSRVGPESAGADPGPGLLRQGRQRCRP